jgi:hypothetical protein
MGKISNDAELKATIRELELKTVQQEKALKEHAKLTAQSFKPANLLRTGLMTVKKSAETRDIRSMAVNTFIGLAAGYLTKKLVVGNTRNIFKRSLGAAVQAAMTKMVYRKLPLIQEKTTKLIAGIGSKNGRPRKNQL